MSLRGIGARDGPLSEEETPNNADAGERGGSGSAQRSVRFAVDNADRPLEPGVTIPIPVEEEEEEEIMQMPPSPGGVIRRSPRPEGEPVSIPIGHSASPVVHSERDWEVKRHSFEVSDSGAAAAAAASAPVSVPTTTTAPQSENGKKVVPIHFMSEKIEEPFAPIDTPDLAAVPPRQSRKVLFHDDGKLFEGHLTVESRSLKTIIQFLVDRQSEQRIIIEDLQDQLHTMRTKMSKQARSHMLAKGATTGEGGAGGGAGPSHRKVVDAFLSMWGIRPEEMVALAESYGDPVVTPDQYTQFLLDLPAFKATRREAMMALASLGRKSSLSNSNVMASAATGPSARAGKRAGAQDGQPPRETQLTPGSEAVEVAHQALEIAQRLEKEMTENGPGVDSEARENIDELGEFVTRLAKDLEKNKVVGPQKAFERRSAPSSVRGAGDSARETGGRSSRSRREEAAAGGSTRGGGKRDAGSASGKRGSGSGPTGGGGSRSGAEESSSKEVGRSGGGAGGVSRPQRDEDGEPGVDYVARGDAEKSMQMVEDLEVSVEKRLRDLHANVAQLAKAVGAPPPAALDTRSTGRPGTSSRGGRGEDRGDDDRRGGGSNARSGSRGGHSRRPGDMEGSATEYRSDRVPAPNRLRGSDRHDRHDRNERGGSRDRGSDRGDERVGDRGDRHDRNERGSSRDRGGDRHERGASRDRGGERSGSRDRGDSGDRDDRRGSRDRGGDRGDRDYRGGRNGTYPPQGPPQRYPQQYPPQHGGERGSSGRRGDDGRGDAYDEPPSPRTEGYQRREGGRGDGRGDNGRGGAGDYYARDGYPPPQYGGYPPPQYQQAPLSPNHGGGGDDAAPTSSRGRGPRPPRGGRNGSVAPVGPPAELVELQERQADFEEEMGKRLQAMEDRLRVIGRSVAGPPGSTPNGPSVDRKAREDASLSMMRVQQLDREVQQLKRLLGATKGLAGGPGVDLSAGSYSTLNQSGDRRYSSNPAGPQSQAYSFNPVVDYTHQASEIQDVYDSRVEGIEKDVGNRMEDVNRAISLLKGLDAGQAGIAPGGPLQSSLAALMQAANQSGLHLAPPVQGHQPVGLIDMNANALVLSNVDSQINSGANFSQDQYDLHGNPLNPGGGVVPDMSMGIGMVGGALPPAAGGVVGGGTAGVASSVQGAGAAGNNHPYHPERNTLVISSHDYLSDLGPQQPLPPTSQQQSHTPRVLLRSDLSAPKRETARPPSQTEAFVEGVLYRSTANNLPPGQNAVSRLRSPNTRTFGLRLVDRAPALLPSGNSPGPSAAISATDRKPLPMVPTPPPPSSSNHTGAGGAAAAAGGNNATMNPNHSSHHAPNSAPSHHSAAGGSSSGGAGSGQPGDSNSFTKNEDGGEYGPQLDVPMGMGHNRPASLIPSTGRTEKSLGAIPSHELQRRARSKQLHDELRKKNACVVANCTWCEAPSA